MDPVTNADNTNMTPSTDGTTNDLGATAMPSSDAAMPTPAAMPEPMAPVATDDATNVVEQPGSMPTEPIIGMSAPIDDTTTAEAAPIDLPAVSDMPEPQAEATPENIPVEPAPSDTASTPDANMQGGSF